MKTVYQYYNACITHTANSMLLVCHGDPKKCRAILMFALLLKAVKYSIGFYLIDAFVLDVSGVTVAAGITLGLTFYGVVATAVYHRIQSTRNESMKKHGIFVPAMLA